jgi:hypothetical protein
MFKGLRTKISITYGIITGTISVTAILLFVTTNSVVFGGH